MRRTKPKPAPEDRTLFREAVADVRPLEADRIMLSGPSPRPHPQQRQADEREVMAELLSDPVDLSEVETGDELLFARPGLQHSVMRKLRRGHYSVGAQLDLHGMTAAQARTALVEFLRSAQARGLRCVRIIHGKGLGSRHRQPVLKVKVNHWLRQREEVLAFASTPPTDGGTGAVYVLLSRN